VQDLPRARVAHLATHGYFAAPDSAARRHLYDPDAFLVHPWGQRGGVAVQHPLLQVGLVLAGANRPPAEGEPGGILTGEVIAGLPLDDLELAVLSACESGLGEANVGEGVYGLQRAFHVAGCKNVVASLWRVDDEATAALMAVFYHQLWAEKRPPLEALRRAQLALLRHPADVATLARSRGPDFDETVKRVGRPTAPRAERKTSPVKQWAAFVLSGSGR
jgi:CHAT domain-containing protein